MRKEKVIASFLFVRLAFCLAADNYDATWDSLDTRPLPSWYDEAKVGIFIHWGIFSVPSYFNEWYWWELDGNNNEDVIAFHNKTYGPDYQYNQFGADFTCELWDPE